MASPAPVVRPIAILMSRKYSSPSISGVTDESFSCTSKGVLALTGRKRVVSSAKVMDRASPAARRSLDGEFGRLVLGGDDLISCLYRYPLAEDLVRRDAGIETSRQGGNRSHT